MTSRSRVMLCMLFAVFAASGITAATASAIPQWQVENKVLEPKEKFEIGETKVEKTFTFSLTVKKIEIKIECGGIAVNGGFIEGTATGGAKSIEFTKCKVKSPENCEGAETITVKGGEIILVAQVGKAVQFVPTGKKATTITLKGAKCLAAGSYEVMGILGANAPKGEEQLKSHQWEFNEESGTELFIEKPEKANVRLTGNVGIWIGTFHLIWGNT